MRKSIKATVAGTLCGNVMMTVLPAEAWAGPMSVASPSSVTLSTPVDPVRYRHRHRHYGYYPRRYRYGNDPGAAMFAGAALGLMGAGIAAATAPRYYGYGWGVVITPDIMAAITPDTMAAATTPDIMPAGAGDATGVSRRLDARRSGSSARPPLLPVLVGL